MNGSQILKEHKIWKETQITNEHQILIEHKVARETQLETQIMKPKLRMNPKC